LEVFSKTSKEMLRFMVENGFESVPDMVGVAHPDRH